MQNLRCLIVDDEVPSCALLRNQLMQFPDVEVVGECGSVASAIEGIRRLQPNVLLLDIQLGPESGFTIPASLESPPHIIFVTGFDQYAVRAFELNAVDYLLKPVSAARLSEAITRVRQRSLLPLRPSGQLQEDDLALIPLGNSGFFTQVRDILVIEAQNHHSRITLDSGRVCIVRRQLREWIQSLPATMFQPIDRSFLINIDRIVEVNSCSRGGVLTLGNRRVEVPLGRAAARRMRQLLELKQHLTSAPHQRE
ncbi:MAG: Sensory transduction protein lytT [Planctomycetota bacterium]|jgi:two-component system LytT family response regulator